VEENGQWRIGTPPAGLLLSSYIFDRYYSLVSLYYMARAGTHVVPEAIHLPETLVTPTSVVLALLEGPSPTIELNVSNAIPASVGLGPERATIDAQGVVTVDLTGRNVAEPDRQFLSTTSVNLNSTGGDTHLDIIADEIRSASLDGDEFDVSDYDGYRLPLPHLERGEHTIDVVAVCRYSHTGEGLHRFVDPADQRVYLYTQFETADSRRMYAVAEQPDQKATFQLAVLAPIDWVVFSNATGVQPTDIGDGFGKWKHAVTPRISSSRPLPPASSTSCAARSTRSRARCRPRSRAAGR